MNEVSWRKGTKELSLAGAPGDGIGEGLMIRIDSPHKLQTPRINNGDGRSARFYRRNNRVRKASITTSNGIVHDMRLLDRHETRRIRLTRRAKARWVRLTFRPVYRGRRWGDTAIGGFRADFEEFSMSR